MITANLYSREQLPDPTREAIQTGFELLSAQVGAIVIKDCVQTNLLSRDKRRGLDVARIHLAKFDPSVDLHVFMAPYFPKDKAKAEGFAGLNTGMIFLNGSQAQTRHNMAGLVMHETAHSLGYLLENAPQRRKDSGAHCADNGCVMALHPPNAMSTNDLMEIFQTDNPERVAGHMLKRPVDFCGSCSEDIDSTIDQQIGELRRNRRRRGTFLTLADNL